MRSSWELKCLQGFSKTLWMGIYNIETLQLKRRSSIVVVTAGFQEDLALFVSPRWSVFDSQFTKFMLGSSWGITFVILVEDFDTGGPSLITVR